VTLSNSQLKGGVDTSGLDLRHLKASLAEIFAEHESVSGLYQHLTTFIISLTGAAVVSIGSCKGTEPPEDISCITDKGHGWGNEILATLQQGGKRAIERKQVAVARLAGQDGVFLIAVPVEKNSSEVLAICAAVEATQQSPDIFIVIFQLLAQCLSLWMSGGQDRETSPLATYEHNFSEIHSGVAAALASGDRKQAGPVFVQKIKEYFQADVVMLAPGLQSVGGQSILHSSITGFSESAPQMKLIKQVVAECKQQKRMLTWKLEPLLPETLQSLLLRDMTVALFAGQSVCFPLREQSGAVIGALIVCWNEPQNDLALRIKAILKAELLIAGLVGWVGQSMYRKQLDQSFLTPQRRSILFAVIILGIFFVGWLPVSFTVSGKCVLEPREKRFVVAQFDAVLKKVHKLPGTTVTEGELLAEFDERTIELEINSLLAEIQKTRKMQDVHTATGKAALSQMAVLERRGLEEQLQLFRDRLSKLSVESPVDGIVISENMERVEGSPISRGQGLFEIAPLKTMIAEAHIAQEDIGYVQEGADTTITLESFPDKTWQSTVYTIFPRADLREGKSVFLVESLIENSEKILRPGMGGEFEIMVGKKPLAWKLFRKPWIYFQKTFLND
jgi:multidrug efflux pump subunit AcrA (membrane-fusion protein)